MWSLLACTGGAEPAAPLRPTVDALIVLDTVRADHTSACGYGRPTTPRLQALAANGAFLSCDLLVPGSWTLPSHASFFTGANVTEHGAHFTAEGHDLHGSAVIRPLDDSLPTLATLAAARGAATVAVSANPVVSEETGLLRGFETTHVADRFRELDGVALVDATTAALAEHDGRQRAFLFVNIADAHAPWLAIREHAWLPDTRGGDPDIAGASRPDLTPDERAEMRRRHTDLYDHAVERADTTLGALLDALQDGGWWDETSHLVVTSDHGEFLTEHGLVDHGRYLYEANQRVFALSNQVELPPGELAGAGIFELVAEQEIAALQESAEAVAYPDQLWRRLTDGRRGVHTSAAVWGTQKLIWQDGQVQAWDLDDVEAPVELVDVIAKARLDDLVLRVQASADRPVEPDEAALERLRAAGYVE